METKKIIDMLTKDSVSILTQKFIEEDGVRYQVGKNHRCAYVNSVNGRENLQTDEPEDISSVILAYWGSEPTVIEEIESQYDYSTTEE